MSKIKATFESLGFHRNDTQDTRAQKLEILRRKVSDLGLAIITYDTAPPTEGTHSQGEVVFNAAAAVGQPIGWQCTADGEPGTWVAMVNL